MDSNPRSRKNENKDQEGGNYCSMFIAYSV